MNGHIQITQTKEDFLKGDRDRRDADLFDGIVTVNTNIKDINAAIKILQHWRYVITGGLIVISVALPLVVSILN